MPLRLNPLGRVFLLEMQDQQSRIWTYALAQAAVDSSFFRSPLVTKTNNPWGIKWAHQSCATPIDFPVVEVDAAGDALRVVQRFAKWPSVGHAVSSYYRLVERRYNKSWRARTPYDFYRGMARWSQEPHYFDSCMNVYCRLFDECLAQKVTE